MCDALSIEFAVTPVTEEEEVIFRRIVSIYDRFTQQDHRRHLQNPRLHVMPGHSSKRNIGISGYTMNILDTDPLLPDIINERLFTGVTKVRLMPDQHMAMEDLNQSLFMSRANEFDRCVREIKNVPKHLQLSLSHFPGYSKERKASHNRETSEWECCLDSGAAFVGIYSTVVEHEVSGYPETQFYAVVRAGCGLVSKQLYTELQQNLSSHSKTMTVKQYFQDERVCWAADAAVRNRLRILARVASVFGCSVQLATDDVACAPEEPDTYNQKLADAFTRQHVHSFNVMHNLPDNNDQKAKKLNDIHTQHIHERARRARDCLNQLESQVLTNTPKHQHIVSTKSQLAQEIGLLAEEQLLQHHSEVPLVDSFVFDDSSDSSSSNSSEGDNSTFQLEDEYHETIDAPCHVYIVNKGSAHDFPVQFAAPMPDNPRVWTIFNNCTSCHNLTHGVLVCVSPYGGLRWNLGPGRGGAGGWRNPTNGFPTHTGPILNGVQIAQAYDQAYHSHQLKQMLTNTTPISCRISWDGHNEDAKQFNHRVWHGAYRPMDTKFKQACNNLGQKQVWGYSTMVPILVKIVCSSKNLLPTCLL